MMDTHHTGSVSTQLALALPSLPMADPWALCDQHFLRRRPGHRDRNYVESRLAYRIQELAYSTLPNNVRKLLVEAGAKHSKIKTSTGRSAQTLLMPGTTLIREREEREYRVTVTPDGLYALDGQVFKSLSAAARHITGTRWNGSGLTEPQVVLPMRNLASLWRELFPAEQCRLAQLLIERVVIADGGLEIIWRDQGWQELAGELLPGTIGAELQEWEQTEETV